MVPLLAGPFRLASYAPRVSDDVRTIRLDMAYDGTLFRGWARQGDPSVRTVEGVLSELLERTLGESVRLFVAGRTDAGVHARGQVASFTTGSDRQPERIMGFVNGEVAPEVVITAARVVPETFHARFSATAREYRYVIRTADVADPFTGRFEWHRPGTLHVPSMRASARHVTGEHDFASFCRHPGVGKPTVRTLQRVTLAPDGERLVLSFRANAFLHQMVRSLVGTLVRVGEGRLAPDDVARILATRDRRAAGQLAPARGLTLERVTYGRR
jgi:tRNA pseudouridine38-40 synthase